MAQTTRVLINGFGRIGRSILRQVLTNPANTDIEVVAINDIAPLETCVYLFRYDSVFGPYPGDVDTGPAAFEIDGRSIAFWNHADVRHADLSGVDVVLECTGRATTSAIAEAGLEAGARAVLISGPSDAAEQTLVMGANDHDLGAAQIVSNASCTTNAIAPLMKTLDAAFGIQRAHVTTIHCYTGSQPTVDVPGPSLERSRAAAVSMIPTTTSAAAQIDRVLPGFRDRISVTAVRVPCLSVSAVDAVFQLSALPDGVESLSAVFKDNPVIGMIADPCVSTDMRARPDSLVIALPETRIVPPTQVRVFGWYDNEWGFSARMIDMARRLAHRDRGVAP